MRAGGSMEHVAHVLLLNQVHDKRNCVEIMPSGRAFAGAWRDMSD